MGICPDVAEGDARFGNQVRRPGLTELVEVPAVVAELHADLVFQLMFPAVWTLKAERFVPPDLNVVRLRIRPDGANLNPGRFHDSRATSVRAALLENQSTVSPAGVRTVIRNQSAAPDVLGR